MSDYVTPEMKMRGVYGYFCDNKLMYIGSSSCKLTTLEYNHRRWESKYGIQGKTYFRTNLVKEEFSGGEFAWIIPPAMRSLEEVETLEGETIRTHRPPFNIDQDPVATSKRYGRY